MTGGTEGARRDLGLTGEGRQTAEDHSQPRVVSVQVAQDRFTKVAKLLSDLCPFRFADRPFACPDCFLYVLEAEFDEAVYRAVASDANLPDTGLFDLVSELDSVLIEALSGDGS